MKKEEEKAVIEDIANLSTHLYYDVWNQSIEYEDIFSEALFWAASRLDYLIAIREENIKSYRAYISVSIRRLVNRFAKKYHLEQSEMNNSRFTRDKVKAALYAHESWAMDLVSTCCTEKQQIAIYGILNGESIENLQEVLKVKAATVKYHFDAGVENIVVKNYRIGFLEGG